jgi:hypothetical protein
LIFVYFCNSKFYKFNAKKNIWKRMPSACFSTKPLRAVIYNSLSRKPQHIHDDTSAAP